MASIEDIQSAIQSAIQAALAPLAASLQVVQTELQQLKVQRAEDMVKIMDRLVALETRSRPSSPVVEPTVERKTTSAPPAPPSTPAPDTPPPEWNPELVAAVVRELTPSTVDDTPVITEATPTINGSVECAIGTGDNSTLGNFNFSLAPPTLEIGLQLILVNLPIVLFAAMHLLLVKSAGIAQFPFDPGGSW